MKVFAELFADPYHAEFIKPDEDWMFDWTATVYCVAGYSEMYVDKGELTELAVKGPTYAPITLEE